MTKHNGPHNTDTKALLQGFLFLPRKWIIEKTKNAITVTVNNLIIYYPQTKKTIGLLR